MSGEHKRSLKSLTLRPTYLDIFYYYYLFIFLGYGLPSKRLFQAPEIHWGFEVQFFENAGLSFSCVRTKTRWCDKSYKACPIREALSKLVEKISIFKKYPDTSGRGLKFFTFYLLTFNFNGKTASFCPVREVSVNVSLGEGQVGSFHFLSINLQF